MIALATSNTLKNTDGFQTALIRYRGNESQYDLDWLNAPSDFYIQVRIPATLQNTKFPIVETTYRQSDGYFRRAKTFIEKTKHEFIFNVAYLLVLVNMQIKKFFDIIAIHWYCRLKNHGHEIT